MLIGSESGAFENSFGLLTAANMSAFRALQELQLLRCGIVDVEPGAFAQLPSLRRVDLRFNRLVAITEGTFRGLSSLDYLDLSHNPINAVHDFAFRSLRVEKLLLRATPELSHIGGKAFAGAILRSLEIRGGNLSALHGDTLRYVVDSLHTLKVSDNLRPLAILDDAFLGLKLRRLALTNNGLTQLTFLEHVVAEEIDLSENPLEAFSFPTTEKLRHTKSLFIESAGLVDIDRRHLAMFVNLNELHMRDNHVTTFDAADFDHLLSLNLLDLSNNRLSRFAGDFSARLPNLHVLRLRGNAIQTLPPSLEALLSRLRDVTLSDNPLHCNCEWLWFARWLDSHRDVMSDAEALTCVTPSRRNVTQTPRHAFHCSAPVILNASATARGLSCTAEGDPPPSVEWRGPRDERLALVTPHEHRHHFRCVANLDDVTSDVNYTCVAYNSAGEERVVVSTSSTSTGKRFVANNDKMGKVSILESPIGLAFTLLLLAMLGYLFRYN